MLEPAGAPISGPPAEDWCLPEQGLNSCRNPVKWQSYNMGWLDWRSAYMRAPEEGSEHDT